MSTVRDLVDGTAQALAAAGIGSAGDVIEPGAPRPILAFRSRTDSPDDVLVIATYPRPAPHEHGIQVRCRGRRPIAGDEAVGAAAEVADDVRRALHGLRDQTWGETDVTLLWFVSLALLGPDDNDRDEVAVNFAALTSDPSTSLVDLD